VLFGFPFFFFPFLVNFLHILSFHKLMLIFFTRRGRYLRFYNMNKKIILLKRTVYLNNNKSTVISQTHIEWLKLNIKKKKRYDGNTNKVYILNWYRLGEKLSLPFGLRFMVFNATFNNISVISFVSSNPTGPGVLYTTLCDKVCQWLAAGWWFSLGALVSFTK
jgi:hypothetical protein